MIHSPWLLLLLLVVPLVVWRLFRAIRKVGIQFSSLSQAGRLPASWRQHLIFLPKILTIGTLLLIGIGIARPREGRNRTITSTEGIAIEMLIDRSSSMQLLDFKIDGEFVDRLTVVKNVASKFILGEEGLTGRSSDLIGIIGFAGFADALVPPTLDHTFAVSRMQYLPTASQQSEDGTAIGDAIALAVEKLNSLEYTNTNEGDATNPEDRETSDVSTKNGAVKSKVIILLTDGENTAGIFDPIESAELAATFGIRIYTIGVGSKNGARMRRFNPFTRRVELVPVETTIDEELLQRIAEISNGSYFRAVDADSLKNIYAAIDELEKTIVESEEFTDYSELAVQPTRLKGWLIPPLLLVAFVLLAVRVVLENTFLRVNS